MMIKMHHHTILSFVGLYLIIHNGQSEFHSVLDVDVDPANQLSDFSGDFDLSNQIISDPPLTTDTSIINSTQVKAKYGSAAILGCPFATHDSLIFVYWMTNQKTELQFNESLNDVSVIEKKPGCCEDEQKTIEQWPRISVLRNGSLLITSVMRVDAGHYFCVMEDRYHGNISGVVTLTLDYEIVGFVTRCSLLIGFMSAFGLFLIAVVLGAIRYCTYVCSEEERSKRKSIREVLNIIRSSSHMDRLTAFKTAKLDRFSSFRSTTMDQLVAFKTAKIDKLRRYKHATVLSIQQYLDRMREHYSAQTHRVKRTCAARMNRLKRNYAMQCSRLKDHHSAQMKRIRENYNQQRAKIREYSNTQKSRLRDQYKVQQQHVIKLLELLDIGNCVNVIRADCEQSESDIFDDTDDIETTREEGSDARLNVVEEDDGTPSDIDCNLLDGIDDEDSNLDDGRYGDDEIVENDLAEDLNFDGCEKTMEDVLSDIAEQVELIQNGNVSGIEGKGTSRTLRKAPQIGAAVGGVEDSGFASRNGYRAVAPPSESNIVSITVSLKDLHSASAFCSVDGEGRGNRREKRGDESDSLMEEGRSCVVETVL